ncbi:transporter [Saliphagus infecundisoli]|uniref:Transporter n=1 Tax=Saliphagus infecundisoli TaxID=1849069 RepID=A0ABD5QKZ5_9EURY|nr:transporter [Saliphagus infecundisoli]
MDTATHPSPSDAGLGPTTLVFAVASVACHGLVRLAERTLPAFLAALGWGPIAAGVVATVGLAVAVGIGGLGPGDSLPRAAVAALAALGLVVWAGAPAIDGLLGTPLSALGWLLVGATLLAAWNADGVVGPDGSGFAATGPLADTDGSRGAGDAGLLRDPRTRHLAGAVGTAGAAGLAAATFAGTGADAGFPVLAVTGAVCGLTAAAGGADRRRPDDPDRGDSPSRADPTPVTGVSDVAELRREWESLPAGVRTAAVGDGLVRAATSLVALSLVLVVDAGVSIAPGRSLPPLSAFALLVGVESLGALAGVAATPAIVERADPRRMLTGGLAVLAVVPLSVVAAGPDVAVLGVLFALFGARTALRPFRPTLGGRATAPPGADDDRRTVPRTPPTVRGAIRAALVLAPLAGGALYALSPVVAFGLATSLGLLGVRELSRSVG